MLIGVFYPLIPHYFKLHGGLVVAGWLGVGDVDAEDEVEGLVSEGLVVVSNGEWSSWELSVFEVRIGLVSVGGVLVRELGVRDGVVLLVGSSIGNVEAPGVRCERVRTSKAMGSGVNGVSWDGSVSELVVSGGTGHS